MQPLDVEIAVSVAAAAVTSFNTSRNCLQTRNAAVLFDLLVKFSALNHFDISSNPGLGGDGVAAVLGSLAGMHSRMHKYFCLWIRVS